MAQYFRSTQIENEIASEKTQFETKLNCAHQFTILQNCPHAYISAWKLRTWKKNEREKKIEQFSLANSRLTGPLTSLSKIHLVQPAGAKASNDAPLQCIYIVWPGLQITACQYTYIYICVHTRTQRISSQRATNKRAVVFDAPIYERPPIYNRECVDGKVTFMLYNTSVYTHVSLYIYIYIVYLSRKKRIWKGAACAFSTWQRL